MRTPPPWPRLDDWPERLAALVEARRHLPFAWGTQDCVTLAADAVLACTGRDPHVARGAYAGEAEAEAILAGEGGLEGWVAATLAAFGAPEIPPALAQRGDWALVVVGNETLCGPVIGESVAVPGTDRLRFVPLARIRRAWAV
jgi:hypothetical protein